LARYVPPESWDRYCFVEKIEIREKSAKTPEGFSSLKYSANEMGERAGKVVHLVKGNVIYKADQVFLRVSLCFLFENLSTKIFLEKSNHAKTIA